MNALTKARIMPFERAKKDSFLGGSLNGHLDHRWFETFCDSDMNFPRNGKDREDQIKLCSFINNNQSGPVLFDYVQGKDLAIKDDATNQWKDATINLYDSVIFKLMERDKLESRIKGAANRTFH
jgi:hypothetical protein